MDIKAFYIVVVALVAGCSSPATRVLADATSRALPAKAVIDVPDVREAIEIEKQTDANSGASAPDGTQWFEILEGPTPVIVTAPHATKPFREGEYRFADGGGTAALAKMLNKLAGVTVVYTTFASPSDPNFYDDNDFKKAVDTLISSKHPVFFLDLHGSNAYRPYDVDLGTMNGKSLLGQDALALDIVEALRAEGLTNISYNYFPAAANQTLTKFASARGVPAIQLEINTTWLVPVEGDLAGHRFAQLLQALVRYLDARTGAPTER
jgi:hypothetical protein